MKPTGEAAIPVQRLAAYGVVIDRDEVLLTRISPRGYNVGAWTLPGGGVDHGESPADGVVREIYEETGLRARVGALLAVHDVHFVGRAHSGRLEDYHGVHLIYSAAIDPAARSDLRVVEDESTTDAIAWVPAASLTGWRPQPESEGQVWAAADGRPVLDLVRSVGDAGHFARA